MDILEKIKVKRDLQLEKEMDFFKQPSLKEALLFSYDDKINDKINNKIPTSKQINIIGEIKRASPSKGQIADKDFNLLKQAQHYVDNNIAAFSILTEEEYFKGDNEFIKTIRKAFPNKPILRKDFIYTPFQVAHSKFLGASAILLIVRMLDDEKLYNLHKLAHDLELDVLVEIHDEIELERALRIPNLEILGINNRNLNTFEVDIKTTEKLIAKIPENIKKDLIIVGESGFLTKEDLEYAKSINVNGLLIGEALMRGNLF